MSNPSTDTVWNMSDTKLIMLLNSEALVASTRKIRFYAPSFTYYKTSHFCSSAKDFPTISITGNSCALNCKHCGGKVLETMNPAKTPSQLFDLCVKLKQNGAVGCLISGGCSPDGSVPLREFIATLARIKNELGLIIFVHSGIIDFETALQLKEAKVDAVLIDIIGSEETIRDVYNLKTTLKEYENSLKALHKARMNFIPHIITGLHQGKLKGELTALKMIAPYDPSAVVIISFMPIHGTSMAKTNPPTPIEISRVTAAARTLFPHTPLVLGCMRPKGNHRAQTDLFALKAGVDGIAFPSEEVLKYAESKDYAVSFSSFCCAQIYKDMLSTKA